MDITLAVIHTSNLFGMSQVQTWSSNQPVLWALQLTWLVLSEQVQTLTAIAVHECQIATYPCVYGMDTCLQEPGGTH